MKACANPMCPTRPAVSLLAAFRLGWQFAGGRLWCATCRERRVR